MGITLANKTVNVNHIECGGSVEVTLALTASPDLVSNPTDIVLILDRSGSMAGEALENMKSGADKFIDIIAAATGGGPGQIGSGSRIGIVSFAGQAQKNTPMTTSVSELKMAIAGLTAGGETNHGDAFIKARELMLPSCGNARVMVKFTDGETTTGPNPSPIAASIRAEGTIIYAIGLVGENGVDEATLNDWATPPSSTHVLIAPDDQDLEDLFEDLAKNISKPGATNIRIDEFLNNNFKITCVMLPDKGHVVKVSDTSLLWTIPELGVKANESATLRFVAEHCSNMGGTMRINDAVTYSDSEGNVVVFPDPEVTVDCGTVVHPEECPEPIPVSIDGCQDNKFFDLGDTFLESSGRILQLDVNVKNVCPGRRVALAVILNELDEEEHEHKRGLKTVVIPAHNGPSCRDVRVRCLKFVLPESLAEERACGCICRRRNFVARVISHYIDHDFECCDDDDDDDCQDR